MFFVLLCKFAILMSVTSFIFYTPLRNSKSLSYESISMHQKMSLLMTSKDSQHEKDESTDNDTDDSKFYDDLAVDFNILEDENLFDQSMEKAVSTMLKESNKEPELTPTQKFQALYETIKSSKNTTSTTSKKLDATDILATLFTDKPVKEPFDDRKVIMKLRQALDAEDFNSLFRDPMIGDIY